MKGGYTYSSEAVSDEYLQVNNCGRLGKSPFDITTNREHGRIDYQIIYVLKGNCIVNIGEGQICLSVGDVLLFKPKEKQSYTLLRESEMLWVHFTGAGCENLLKECNIQSGRAYKTGDVNHIPDIFEKIIGERILKYPLSGLKCNSLLIMLLVTISRIANTQGMENEKIDNRIIKVLEKMHKDCSKDIDLDKYAEMCHLSKDRFLHVFKDFTGVSPHKYQTELRMEKARDLLRHSSLNVSEVSQLVGYSDICYFSRLFKKYVGCSPKNFR